MNLSYQAELIDQIARDRLAIKENAPPSQFFYQERIADYQQTVLEMNMNENSIESHNENGKQLTGEELLANIESNDRMTPQEKLFAKLFYHETQLVKDMDILTLRAHREELTKIAFEARVRLTAADAAEEKIKKASRNDKPKGFQRSLNVDETTTDAINTIKERQKKLTKAEKIQAGLEKLGISSTDAAKLMTAGVILGRVKDQKSKDIIKNESPASEPKPIFNPFEKK